MITEAELIEDDEAVRIKQVHPNPDFDIIFDIDTIEMTPRACGRCNGTGKIHLLGANYTTCPDCTQEGE